jgi:hypothetical protein
MICLLLSRGLSQVPLADCIARTRLGRKSRDNPFGSSYTRNYFVPDAPNLFLGALVGFISPFFLAPCGVAACRGEVWESSTCQ